MNQMHGYLTNRLPTADISSCVVEVPGTEFKVSCGVYVDSDIFAWEQSEIFEKTWIYVGHESEIPAAGDFRTSAIGRLPVIVTRGPDQKINVLLNICRHRGAAVCNTPSGNASTFVCPYHRWVYNCDGTLAALSSEDGYPPDWSRRIDGLLRAGEVATCHGMIFARMHEGGETLEEFLQPVRKYIDKWFSQSPYSKVRTLPTTTGRYPANWKFQVENTTDGWHARYVHGSAFKILEEHKMRDRQRGLLGTNRGFKYGHGMLDRPLRRFFSPDAMDRYRGLLAQTYGEEEGPQIAEFGGQITIFPNLHLMEHRIRVVQPVSLGETLVYEYPVVFDGIGDEINEEIRARFSEEGGGMIAGFINTDDIEVFTRAQMAMNASRWLSFIDLSRGIGDEKEEADGVLVSDAAHEVSQRAFYREWQRRMQA